MPMVSCAASGWTGRAEVEKKTMRAKDAGAEAEVGAGDVDNAAGAPPTELSASTHAAAAAAEAARAAFAETAATAAEAAAEVSSKADRSRGAVTKAGAIVLKAAARVAAAADAFNTGAANVAAAAEALREREGRRIRLSTPESQPRPTLPTPERPGLFNRCK